MSGIRIDRWLWAARFFKTRSLAKTAVEGGKVHVDGQRTKPAKELRLGQTLTIRKGLQEQTVVVEALSEQRGAATIAQTLYKETPESIELREISVSRRRMERAGLTVPSGRPNKKDRRALSQLKSLDEGWDNDEGA
ncbi:MAG: S4 domain-containing protein [Pseudomonadales bacterium]|jgi:ribosome-associated heat shock protein Hsp15|nr:S4 domain-containing protein [Pseudomonadales bacterium]